MKKTLATILCIFPLAIMMSGCVVSDVSQEDYDDLNAKYEDLKEKYEAATGETVSNNETESDAPSSEKSDPVQNGLRSPENAIPIHDDEYVTISFLGCETGSWEEQQLVFYVVNKANTELTFQANTMAIDGESLGYVSGSDDIAALGKGKIRYSTEEDFPTMTPATITGTIRVIDFSKTAISRGSYDAAFTNVEVK